MGQNVKFLVHPAFNKLVFFWIPIDFLQYRIPISDHSSGVDRGELSGSIPSHESEESMRVLNKTLLIDPLNFILSSQKAIYATES